MTGGRISVLVITSLLFLFLLTSTVLAQIAVGDTRCPDKCERSTLYQGGYYDEKLRVCIYKTEIPCKYDCRVLDNKTITEPACNELNPNSTSTSLEMIYAQMKKEFLSTAKPISTMSFHGTEYIPGKPAKAWLQLLDPVNVPIDDSLCYIHIFTPIGSQFLGKTTMTHISEGVYSYDFTVPLEEGVYPMIAECYYNASQNMTYMTGYWLVSGWSTYASGTVANTYTSDGTFLVLREERPTGVNPYRFQGGFNISQMCQPEEAISKGITVHWEGKWDSVTNDDMTISLWNYTSGTWLSLPNKIISQATTQIVTNSLTSFTNLTKAGLTNGTNGGMRIRFDDINMADGGKTDFRTDMFWVSCDQMSGLQWQTVRGSSEMHITSTTAYSYTIDSVTPTLNGTGYLGGYLDANFTVYSASYTNTSDVKVDIHMPYLLGCSEVIHLKRYNGTGFSNINYTTAWDSQTDSCIVSFYEDMTQGGYNQYEGRVQNEWARSLEKQYAEITNRNSIYSTLCWTYALSNGLPYYQVPVNSTLSLNDSFYATCNYYLDTVYRLADSYNTYNADYASITNFEQLKHHETLVQEWNVRYERVKNIASVLTDSLSLLHDYSVWVIQNPVGVPLAGLYFSNGSSSNYIYQWLVHNNQTSVLNYLTEINQTTHNYNQTAVLTYLIDMNNTIHHMNNLSAYDVWSYASRNLTDYNMSGIISMIVSVNNTVKDRSITIGDIWSYYNRTLTDYNQTVIITYLNNINNTANSINSTVVSVAITPAQIWSYVNRTLTDYNQSDMWFYLRDINLTVHAINSNNLTAQEIWDYATRNLTDYNQTQTLIYLFGMNQTLHSLQNLSADDVWNYATRTLTDYNQSGITQMLISLNDTQNQNYQSVMSMLAQINNSLYFEIENVNNSMMGRFTSIDDSLSRMNDTLLNRTEYIINITSILQNNVSSLSSDMQTVIALLNNLTTTNVTNTTFDWTPFYNNVRNLFFSGGIVGVEAQEMGNATCISDDILRRTIDSTGMVNNDTLVTSKTYDTYCEYGCSRGSCRMPPYYYAGALLVIIVIMGIIYMLWSRRQETIIYR